MPLPANQTDQPGMRIMAREPQGSQWKTLDRDLKRIVQMESATAYVSRPLDRKSVV